MENTENQKTTLRQRIENYWYHYRFRTIAAAFIIFVVIWGIIMAVGRTGEDITIGYVGEHLYTQEQAEDAGVKLSACLDLDLDGNGETEIMLVQYQYLADSQIKELAADAEKKGLEFSYYPEVNSHNYELFENELATGNTSVWMVSPEVYEMMDKSMLMPISEVLGYVPEKGVVDEYAINCMSLPLCCKAVMTLSTNSYLVMRADRQYSFIMGDERMEAELEDGKALFRAIVEYEQ